MTQNLRKQPQNLAETVHLISGKFHKFEANRQLKGKITISLHGRVSKLPNNVHNSYVSIAFSFMR